jgi:hypothetical protein
MPKITINLLVSKAYKIDSINMQTHSVMKQMDFHYVSQGKTITKRKVKKVDLAINQSEEAKVKTEMEPLTKGVMENKVED